MFFILFYWIAVFQNFLVAWTLFDIHFQWLLSIFWKHSLNFCSTFGNDLFNPLFCNVADIVCGGFNNTRGIKCISTSISKVITVKKTSMLPFAFSVCIATISIIRLFFFSFALSCLNFKCSDLMAINHKGLSILISSASS